MTFQFFIWKKLCPVLSLNNYSNNKTTTGGCQTPFFSLVSTEYYCLKQHICWLMKDWMCCVSGSIKCNLKKSLGKEVLLLVSLLLVHVSATFFVFQHIMDVWKWLYLIVSLFCLYMCIWEAFSCYWLIIFRYCIVMSLDCSFYLSLKPDLVSYKITYFQNLYFYPFVWIKKTLRM